MAKEILALIILPLDNNKIVVIIIKITEILLVGANIYRVLTPISGSVSSAFSALSHFNLTANLRRKN